MVLDIYMDMVVTTHRHTHTHTREHKNHILFSAGLVFGRELQDRSLETEQMNICKISKNCLIKVKEGLNKTYDEIKSNLLYQGPPT